MAVGVGHMHEVVVCGGCRSVVAQCKCMLPGKPVRSEGLGCDNCRDLTTMEQVVLAYLDGRGRSVRNIDSALDRVGHPWTGSELERVLGSLVSKGKAECVRGHYRRNPLRPGRRADV